MRTTYLIEIRKLGLDSNGMAAPWIKQTRCKTRPDAEVQAQAWQQRGFEVRIIKES